MLVLLASCESSRTLPVTTVEEDLNLPEPPESVVLPPVQPVTLEKFKWSVVLVDDTPLFALKAKGYEALSRNMAELLRWMKEASDHLRFYETGEIGDPGSATDQDQQ